MSSHITADKGPGTYKPGSKCFPEPSARHNQHLYKAATAQGKNGSHSTSHNRISSHSPGEKTTLKTIRSIPQKPNTPLKCQAGQTTYEGSSGLPLGDQPTTSSVASTYNVTRSSRIRTQRSVKETAILRYHIVRATAELNEAKKKDQTQLHPLPIPPHAVRQARSWNDLFTSWSSKPGEKASLVLEHPNQQQHNTDNNGGCTIPQKWCQSSRPSHQGFHHSQSSKRRAAPTQATSGRGRRAEIISTEKLSRDSRHGGPTRPDPRGDPSRGTKHLD